MLTIFDTVSGVSWVDMHVLANKVMLEELKKGGVLQGNVDDMIEVSLLLFFSCDKTLNF